MIDRNLESSPVTTSDGKLVVGPQADVWYPLVHQPGTQITGIR